MTKTTSTSLATILFFAFSLTQLSAQSKILDSYESFTEAPREIAYAHLNKSTYIEGEIMGFTAYVFDKFTKATSKQTKNLYCTISNENGEVLKKKLIKVDNGVASNAFDIDSTLSSGIFTFKAYTNWMRNFEEQNHYEQTFKVIDADNNDEIIPVSKSDLKLDIQALGEGGHLVYDIPNTLGIIAKNQFGYGIANAYGEIVDNKGIVVSEFQLNDVGISKVLFTPKFNSSYTAQINYNDQKSSIDISGIKNSGFNLKLSYTNDIVRLLLTANQNTKAQLIGEEFQVALHNGNDLILAPFNFKDDGTAVLSFPKTELFSGINIFTIFNAENQPLLERLYFNSDDLNRKTISSTNVSSKADSLSVNFKIDNLKNDSVSNISISVLPTGTKSYNHHNSILSQLYIQPYVNGFLQNGGAYFKTNDRKTAYNLDLLMLTQGWSSYDWNTIFDDNEREYIFPFEKGIDIIANINDQKYGSYVVYPLAQNKTQLFDIKDGGKEFTIKESFPTEDDLFRIGYINTKKKQFKQKPSIYLQHYPSQFPNFNSNLNIIKEVFIKDETLLKPEGSINAWDFGKANRLDEVVITAEANTLNTKIEKLQNKAVKSKFRVIEDDVKLRGMRIDTYIQRLGYDTYYDIFSGKLSIVNPRIRWTDPVPLVYLNDALLTTSGRFSDFGILTFITMDVVDYIEYDSYGIGGGIRGGAGYIKIYTSRNTPSIKIPNNVVTYELPMVFSKTKTYYTPKYQYYNTDFFKEYGTIAWQPHVEFDAEGNAQFIIYDTKTENITLYIEGVVNETEYISQILNIEIDN